MTDTDTAELVAASRAYIAACSGPGITLYDGHPAVLMSKGIDRLTALERERDEAREALKPFSIAAGGVFTRNFNASDTLFLKPATAGHAESKITAGDLFKARAALQPQVGK